MLEYITLAAQRNTKAKLLQDLEELISAKSEIPPFLARCVLSLPLGSPLLISLLELKMQFWISRRRGRRRPALPIKTKPEPPQQRSLQRPTLAVEKSALRIGLVKLRDLLCVSVNAELKGGEAGRLPLAVSLSRGISILSFRLRFLISVV